MPLVVESRYFLDSPSGPAQYYTVSLLVNNYLVTSELDYGSLTVHTMADSTLLVTGTLDATLIDPARIPAIGNLVRFYVGVPDGSGAKFEGYVSSVEVYEHKVGSHRRVTFSAQQNQYYLLSLAVVDQGFSDVPDLPNHQYPYQRLVKKTRIAPDGSSLLSLELQLADYTVQPEWLYTGNAPVVVPPWTAQQAMWLDSVLLGVTSNTRTTAYAIVDATVTFPHGEKGPLYSYLLGVAPVRLKITGSTIAVTNSS